MTDRSDTSWKTLATQVLHETPFLRLEEDRVALPDGREISYGVVRCGHCVGVLPFSGPDHVLLVRQYRYIAGRHTWEMPTGGVDGSESVETAAHRELAEEAGVAAERLVPVSTYHTSKSSLDETAHLFLGFGLSPAEAQPDDTEEIEVRRFLFDAAMDMVLAGEIVDSMTIIAMLFADRRRRL